MNETKDNKKNRLGDKLRTTIIDFNNDLIEQFPDKAEFMQFRLILEATPISNICGACVKFILPHYDLIKKRDEKYFLDENDIFGKISKDKVSQFKKIWTSKKLDKDSKNAIWEWFNLIADQTKKYNEYKE